MKSSHYLAVATALTVASIPPAHALEGVILQVETSLAGEPLVQTIPLSIAASTISSIPFLGSKAVFQLYGVIDTAYQDPGDIGNLRLLDEKTLGVCSATLTPTSLDPWIGPGGIRRTRADYSYGVNIKVEGMPEDGTNVSNWIQLDCAYKAEDARTDLPTAQGDYPYHYDWLKNTTTAGITADVAQNLPVPEGIARRKAQGSETWTVNTQPDYAAFQSQLASATVQIWPVADASFEKLTARETYLSTPQDAGVVVRDIYPSAEVWVQFYKGEVQAGVTASKINSTHFDNKSDLPQQARLSLFELNNLLKEDGVYTLEVVTRTPFNQKKPETISTITFSMRRSLKVVATLGSSD